MRRGRGQQAAMLLHGHLAMHCFADVLEAVMLVRVRACASASARVSASASACACACACGCMCVY